jgi:hypothetical protein
MAFIVVTQQHLRHSQTHQLRISHPRRAAWPTTTNMPARGNDPISKLHVQCNQKGVEICVHNTINGIRLRSRE